MIPGCPTPSHSAAQRRAPVLKRSSNPSLRVAGLQAHATTPGKVPTGVYVNQINLHKLSSCLQNQKPYMIKVNTIQRKGAVRIDVLLTREQVKILNDTDSLKIKMSKPMLRKYSTRELVSKPPNARLFIHLSFLKD